ncbi:response regulator transcription factor [Aeromonas hydrophila]|uniref:response regulator transcription factor n=1 Tax=Aeromonas hydrophila TaxID=644 RepID=UPI0022AF2550|nr:response regulator transcription factor [Aeromonas hydrophila]MCZ4335572.1 response regulator transcription factor [Aeromonas hydrophila]
MARIMIVDDHPAIRMAVSILLQHDQHNICGEADNGVDAVQECKRLQPDLLIVDIGIPKLDGIEVILRVKELLPSICVIVLSAQTSHHFMLRCYQAGADGFVSKLEDISIIKDAVTLCLAGTPFFLRSVISKGKYSSDMSQQDVLATLSNREMSVLRAICTGMSNKQIAGNMLLSEKTISTYKSRIMQKLQVKNMVDLLNFAKQYIDL